MADRVRDLPEQLQLQILALVAGSTSAAPQRPLANKDANYRAWACGLASRLLAHGFAWQDGMAPAETIARPLLRAVQELPESTLASAGMGTSILKWHDTSARGDRICWLPLNPPPADSSPTSALLASSSWAWVYDTLSHVVDAINRDTAARTPVGEALRLPDKVMLAHYPAGGRYVRHSDVSPAVADRRVTCILYLNDGWEPAHGGELRLYPPTVDGTDAASAGNEITVGVEPRLGRLLLFRAAIEHEVLVTNQPRWAVTAWLPVATRSAASPPLRPTPPVSTSTEPTPISEILKLAQMVAAAPPRPAAAAAPPVTIKPANAPPPPARPTTPASSSTEPTPVSDILKLAQMVAAAPPRPAAAAAPDAATPAESTALVTPSATPLAAPIAPAATDANAPAAPTVFVSIASYRDPEAPHTLRSLFESAADPSRVFVGVCFQCDPTDDADCTDLSALPDAWRANVRTISMPWQQAKGPVWARFLIQRDLFADEDYFLQIDSHTRFAPRWEEELIAMLGRCASPKPVLTTYPLPYEGTGHAAQCSDESHATLLCTRTNAEAFGAADGMLRFRARLLAAPLAAPVPTPFWAAGFSFSRGGLVREVPYDPHLPFLFFGEEISIALRMWTRGYDLFTPDKHILFHYWARSYRTTFWEVEGGAQLKARSQARVRRLLTDKPLVADDEPPADGGPQSPLADGVDAPRADDPIWGLGGVRSLRLYEEWSGVDFGAKRVSEQAERGGMPAEACFWDRFACLHTMLAEGGAGGEETVNVPVGIE